MLVFKHNTIVGDYQFKGIVSYESTSTWEHVGDRGTLVVPRNIDLEGKTINEVFPRGTALKIEAGYEQGLANVMDGYISDIVVDSPIKISMQDLSWYFSKINIKETLTGNVTLTRIVKLLVDKVEEDYGITIPYVITAEFLDMGKQRYTNASGTAILESLIKKYRAYSYFRDGILYAGLKYPNINQNTFLFWLDGERNNTRRRWKGCG
jgi:hypothetical protein